MNRNVLMLGVVLMITAVACRKKDGDQPAAKLQINLSQSVVAVVDIDSADIILYKQISSSSSVITKRFTKNSQGLETDISDVTAGDWIADVKVYTKTVNHESLQFAFINSVSITTPAPIQWDGPALGNGWVKRRVKASDGNGVVVIIPDDVYDPYIEFRFNDPNVRGFGVQRSAININYAIASKSWTCGRVCINDQRRVINYTEFLPFTAAIISQAWTRNDISISVFDQAVDELLVWDYSWHR